MQPNTVKVRDVNDPSVVWTLDLTNHTRTMTDATGRTVTMDLGQADVHIDSALSNYAAGYRQWEGIADKVAPVVPVDKASNKYYTWDKDDVFQEAENMTIGPDGKVFEISPRLSSASYSTVGYGIGAGVSTELSANADAPLKIEMAAMRRCLNVVGLAREIRVASLVTTSGNWTGGYTTTLGATAKWNAGTTSDPIGDLTTAIQSSLTSITGIAMSERTWQAFFQNANVQKYIAAKTDLPPLGNTSLGAEMYGQIADKLSGLLGLPPFIIGRQKKKTGASSYGYVWGNNVALLHNEPGVPSDGQSISTAKTFRWSGADSNAPDGTMQGGFLVRTYFDPRRGARGTRVMVVTHNDAEIMTSVFAGGLIINAYQ